MNSTKAFSGDFYFPMAKLCVMNAWENVRSTTLLDTLEIKHKSPYSDLLDALYYLFKGHLTDRHTNALADLKKMIDEKTTDKSHPDSKLFHAAFLFLPQKDYKMDGIEVIQSLSDSKAVESKDFSELMDCLFELPDMSYNQKAVESIYKIYSNEHSKAYFDERIKAVFSKIDSNANNNRFLTICNTIKNSIGIVEKMIQMKVGFAVYSECVDNINKAFDAINDGKSGEQYLAAARKKHPEWFEYHMQVFMEHGKIKKDEYAGVKNEFLVICQKLKEEEEQKKKEQEENEEKEKSIQQRATSFFEEAAIKEKADRYFNNAMKNEKQKVEINKKLPAADSRQFKNPEPAKKDSKKDTKRKSIINSLLGKK